MKDKIVDLVSHAFSTLNCHDMTVDKVYMCNEYIEKMKEYIDNDTLWGAKINEGRKGEVTVLFQGFRNTVKESVSFLPKKYHDPYDPECSVCKVKYRVFEKPKEDPILRLEARMRPGASSQGGFLGPEDKLLDIIEKDKQTLEKLNITYTQIADRFETVVGKAHRISSLDHHSKQYKHGWKYIVDKKYSVYIVAWCGYQDCPWDECENNHKATGSRDYEITNLKTGEKVFAPALITHLLRKHQFFEGHTKYRVDPEQIIKVLDIKPGIDYTPMKASELVWHMIEASSGCGVKPLPEDFVPKKEIALNGAKFYYNDDTLIVRSEDYVKFKKPVIIDGAFFRDQSISQNATYKKESMEYYV